MKRLIKNMDILILILGILNSVFIKNTGLFSSDPKVQLYQAIINYYNDWHPPMMGFVWNKLNNIFGKMDTLYWVHIVIFFSGAFFIMLYIRKKSLYMSLVFLIVITIISYKESLLFQLWKDTGMYVVYIFIIGISLNMEKLKNKYIKLILLGISYILLFYSISIRANSVFSGIIMIFLLFYSFKKELLKSLIISTILWLGILGVNYYFIYEYLHTKKLYPIKYIMISDIYQISYRTNKNIPEFLRGSNYSEEREKEIFENNPNINKYIRYDKLLIKLVGENLLSSAKKNYDKQNLNERDLEEYISNYQNLNDKEILENYNLIKNYWFNLIKENPIMFIKIKIKFFINLVGGLEFIFLMMLNLILQYFYSFKKKKIKQLLIYMSSCFYLWPYLIFNSSYDYRYIAYCILVEIFMFIYIIYTNFEDISNQILLLKKKEKEIMK